MELLRAAHAEGDGQQASPGKQRHSLANARNGMQKLVSDKQRLSHAMELAMLKD